MAGLAEEFKAAAKEVVEYFSDGSITCTLRKVSSMYDTASGQVAETYTDLDVKCCFDEIEDRDRWAYDQNDCRICYIAGDSLPAGITPEKSDVIMYDGDRYEIVDIGGDMYGALWRIGIKKVLR